MTPKQKAAMQQAIDVLEQAAHVIHKDFMLPEAAEALREALVEPAVEPEMHEAMCAALTGGKCNCPTSPAFVDKAWAQFCGGVGRRPNAPYPGMIEAFEAHYAQSFTDRDWRNESGVWAAAWKSAKAHAYPPAVAGPVVEPAFWMNEFGQMCATRGFAERSWPGQKLTPLYTSPPQPADANDDLLLFAALVATHERERCAALVASWNTAMTDKLAREIRASADHPTTNERE